MQYILSLILLAILPVWSAADETLEQRQARVRLLLARHDFAGALQQATEFNQKRPDDIAGYQLLAAAHLGLGNYDEAEKALQWMLDLRIGKADADGWLLVSRFREAVGDIDGALEAVNAGYGRLVPGQDLQARTLMIRAGRLLRLSGKLALADQALQKVPLDDIDALEELALIRSAQGRRLDAIELLRRAAKRNGHPRVLYRLAVTTSDPGDYTVFERAARSCSDAPDNSNPELVFFLVKTGRAKEALSIARRESRRRHDSRTMAALAVALFSDGHNEEARSVMRKVLGVGTRDPEILAYAATMGIKPD